MARRVHPRRRRDAPVRIIANRPDDGRPEEYEHKLREARESHHLPEDEPVLFLEVRPGDVSDFSGALKVAGADVGGYACCAAPARRSPTRSPRCCSIIRDETGQMPHAYFGWTEGNPIVYLLKFLAFGEGDTAPVTREVLRQTEPNPCVVPDSRYPRRVTAASSTPWPLPRSPRQPADRSGRVADPRRTAEQRRGSGR